MSGHSKWATTKHKKAVIDARRGKLFAKLIKNIEVAARIGGGDPAGNPTLYDAIQKAKKTSVPNDNIDRAVKRGSGAEGGGAHYETLMYEAYGPAGVALLIECLTDNRNRSASEVRVAVTRNGGTMADAGSTARMFSRKGVVTLAKEQDGRTLTEDDVLEATLDADPEEVNDLGDSFEIVSDPANTVPVRAAVQAAGLDYDSAEVSFVPDYTVEVDAYDRREADSHHRRPRGLRRRAERLRQLRRQRRGPRLRHLDLRADAGPTGRRTRIGRNSRLNNYPQIPFVLFRRSVFRLAQRGGMCSRPLPPDLDNRFFTTADAYAAGVSRDALRGPTVRRLHTGVYVNHDRVLDLRKQVGAARSALPARTLATGVTALWCLGVEVGNPRPLQFVTSHPHQVRRPGLQVARTRRLPPSRGEVVSAEHAFATAARRLNLVDLVAAGDWLVRRKLTTPERLIAYTQAASWRRRGSGPTWRCPGSSPRRLARRDQAPTLPRPRGPAGAAVQRHPGYRRLPDRDGRPAGRGPQADPRVRGRPPPHRQAAMERRYWPGRGVHQGELPRAPDHR